jgi:hypothetical protein
MDIQKNDIVQINCKNKNLQILKVVYIKDENIEGVDIFTKEKYILPIEKLYDKSTLEDLSQECLNQLKLLKANKIWVFYNKSPKINKNISNPIKNIDEKQIENLRKWFLENKEEYKKEEIIDIFKIKEEKKVEDINIFKENKNSPLSRFIKKI